MTTANIKPRRLKPAEGRRVRHLDGSLFAEAGEYVTVDRYYRRLLSAGDLEQAPLPKKSADKTTASGGEAKGKKGSAK
ncbi:MAG: hypothetical protein COW16_10395 [Sphingomonadales bacterium CG12_big_fil_rev_8_21_14_0_65_65_10]|nr:MAG: hypothetical protein COW16_10395 [Sphingomonadales bacterium CG12_big_fil_rev_8_21_14_0_65_65_10]